MSRTSTRMGDTRPGSRLIDKAKGVPQEGQRLLHRLRARYPAIDVVVGTFTRFSDDDAGTYAAALTYYAFFAIFPLLLFAAAGIGYVTFGNDRLAAKIIDAGIEGVPMLRQALTEDALGTLQEHKNTIAGIGLALALYTGTGMIVALEHALNKVARVSNEGNWFVKRAKALQWLAILGFAAAASVAATSFAAALDGGIGAVAGFAGAFVIDLFIFATAFKFLPVIKASWREVLPGAIVGAVAFSLLKIVGTAYLARGAETRNATYGTLAGAATLLVASYLLSQVTLLAAEVNATLVERRSIRTRASDRTEEQA